MEVVVSNAINAYEGDVIEFNHSGSHGKSSFYMICFANSQGYFILNLSGSKSNKIKFYSSIDLLLAYHKDSIVNIYSQKEWNITLTKK